MSPIRRDEWKLDLSHAYDNRDKQLQLAFRKTD